MPQDTYLPVHDAWHNGDVTAQSQATGVDFVSVGGQDTDAKAGAEEYHSFLAGYANFDVPAGARILAAKLSLLAYETQATDGPKTLQVSVVPRDGKWDAASTVPNFGAQFWPRTEVLFVFSTPATAVTKTHDWPISVGPTTDVSGLRDATNFGSVTLSLAVASVSQIEIYVGDPLSTFVGGSLYLEVYEVLSVGSDGGLNLGPLLATSNSVDAADFNGDTVKTSVTFPSAFNTVSGLMYIRFVPVGGPNQVFIVYGSSLHGDEAHTAGAGYAAASNDPVYDGDRLQNRYTGPPLHPRGGCEPFPIPGDDQTAISANIFASAGQFVISDITEDAVYNMGSADITVAGDTTEDDTLVTALQAWVDDPDYVRNRELLLSVYSVSDTGDDAWRFYSHTAGGFSFGMTLRVCYESFSPLRTDPVTSWDSERADPVTSWDSERADPASDWNEVRLVEVSSGTPAANCTPVNQLCIQPRLFCSEAEWSDERSDPATSWSEFRTDPDACS